MPNKRGSADITLIIIIAAAVVVLAGAYCLALKAFWLSKSGQSGIIRPVQQNQAIDETDSWKTYTNEYHGFEIKYPNICEEGTLADELANFMCSVGSKSLTDSIKISFFDKPIDKTVESVIIANTFFDGSGLHPKSISDFTQVKINGDIFYKIRTGRFEGTLSYVYYLIKNNTIFAFSFASQGVDWTNPTLDEEADGAHVILKQMLSTLEFTNLSSANAANWKTYTNTQFGYQINYPLGWVTGISTILNGSPVVFCPSTFADSDITVVCKVKSAGHLDTYAMMLLRRWTINDAPKYLGNRHLWTDPSGKYVIELQLADTNYKDIFDQMVSTFKFNQTTSADTLNWKTYSNNKFGFEIKYPADTQISNTNDYDTLSNQPILMGVIFKPAASKGILIINVRGASVDLVDSPTCYDTALGVDPSLPSINGINFVKWNISKYISQGIGPWDDGREYCVIHNKVAYNLILETAYESNVNETLDVDKDSVLNQMLSSFKFTK